MLTSFVRGFGYPFRGLRLMLHPRLRAFALLPFLINTVLFAAGFWWIGNGLYATINGWITQLPTWLAWLAWLIVPLLSLAALLILFYGFTLVANIVGAPFNGTLAERTEDLQDPDNQRPQRPLWKDLLVAPVNELRKLVYFLCWGLPLLVLLLIPGLNAFFPLLWGGFGAWMMALQYLDYPLGNHGLPFATQRRVAQQQRALTLGFGSGVLLMTLVPGLNFLSMPAAVIGATLLSVDARLPMSIASADRRPAASQ